MFLQHPLIPARASRVLGLLSLKAMDYLASPYVNSLPPYQCADSLGRYLWILQASLLILYLKTSNAKHL